MCKRMDLLINSREILSQCVYTSIKLENKKKFIQELYTN